MGRREIFGGSAALALTSLLGYWVNKEYGTGSEFLDHTSKFVGTVGAIPAAYLTLEQLGRITFTGLQGLIQTGTAEIQSKVEDFYANRIRRRRERDGE